MASSSARAGGGSSPASSSRHRAEALLREKTRKRKGEPLSREESARIRAKVQAEKARLLDEKEQLEDPSNSHNAVMQALERGDELWAETLHAKDLKYEYSLLQTSVKSTATAAKTQLETDFDFTLEEIVDDLIKANVVINDAGEREYSFAKALQRLGDVPHRFPPPTPNSFLAALASERRTKTRAKRVKKEKHTDAQAHKEADDAAPETETLTDARVKQLYKALKKATKDGPVSMYDLLLNPESFTQTVENFFDLTFVIKENRVRTELGEDGCTPMLTALPAQLPQATSGIPPVQSLFKLNFPTYHRLCEQRDFKPCLVPTRPLPDSDEVFHCSAVEFSQMQSQAAS